MANGVFDQILVEILCFSPTDALTVLTLAILEGILSVDNSLVLAILVRSLPKEQQRKALLYGIVGAFLFRFLALVFAVHLIRFVFFKLIGGAYLVYLAMKHMFFFYKEEAHQPRPKVAGHFWKTVLVVEMTDVAFSIDSITTAVAMSDKLLIVWLGGLFGIIFLRFAANFFIGLLEKLPKLEDLAYQLIFFIGVKLLLESFRIEIEPDIFWLMIGVIVVLGSALVYRDHFQRKTQSQYHHRLVEKLEAREITVEEVLALKYIPSEVIRYLLNHNHLKICPQGCDSVGEQQTTAAIT